MRQWTFWARGLGFVAALMLLSVACGKPKTGNCGNCKGGDKKCAVDGLSILTCKISSTDGCWDWVQDPCAQGTVCNGQSGLPTCVVDKTGQCTTSCTAGSQQCQGTNVMTCQVNPSTSCPEWSVSKQCAAGETCDPTTLQCKAGGCTAQNPQATKKCVGSAVHWFDDCGQQGQQVEACNAPMTCENGACKSPNGCTPTNTEVEKKCDGDSVYWFDDCGNKAQMIETCINGFTCQGGKCVQAGCQPNNPQVEKKCVGSTVYWFDDCGKQSTKVEDCNPPKKCEAGACTGGGTTCTPETEQRCVGNDVYFFDSCGKQGKKITTCSGSQVCKNGSCQNSTATCPAGGNQCTLGSFQCQNNGVQSCQKDPTTGCSAGQVCQNGQCAQTNTQTCQYQGNFLLFQCKQDSDCCNGFKCDKRPLLVVKSCGCNTDADCPPTQEGTATQCCPNKACLLSCN